MSFFVSGPNKDKGFFTISRYICDECCHKKCENVNVPIFKDGKKAREWMAKNVKKKISSYFSCSFFYTFLMTKGTSRNDVVRLYNIGKLSHWCAQRGRYS